MREGELNLTRREESRRICAYCRNLAGSLVYACPACRVSLHQECLRSLCRDRKGGCPSLGCEVGFAEFEGPRKAPAAAIVEEERARRAGRRRAQRRLREGRSAEGEVRVRRQRWRRVGALGLLAGLVSGAPALALAVLGEAGPWFAPAFALFLALHILLNVLVFRLIGDARAARQRRLSLERAGPAVLGGLAGLVYVLGLLPPMGLAPLTFTALFLAGLGAFGGSAYAEYLRVSLRGFDARRRPRTRREERPAMSAEEVAEAIAIAPRESSPSEDPS